MTNVPIEKFCLELSQNPKTMFKNVEGIITFYEDLHHCLSEETNKNWPSWWSNISLVPFFKVFAFLRNANQKPSFPIAYINKTNEAYERMKQFLTCVQCERHK